MCDDAARSRRGCDQGRAAGSGDGTRQWGPPWYDAGDEQQSAYYLSVNRNKRSVALNLKAAAGRDLARQLTARSQVVVENFTPGQMVGFGLGYEDLRAIQPALVYCSITGFGQLAPTVIALAMITSSRP